MKIEDTTTRTIKIWDLPEYFDIILVNLSNTYPGAGRLTLTADSDSWSHYWNAMGEDRPLEQFLLDTNVSYIVMKLGSGISSTLDRLDDEKCVRALQQAIARRRRKGWITKEEARSAYDELEGREDVYNRYEWGHDFEAYDLLDGDDVNWPEADPNPAYERLAYAVTKMREALTQLKEKTDAVATV